MSRDIQRLGEYPEAIDTNLRTPAQDPSNRWAIEIALDSRGLPSNETQELVLEGMTIRDVGPWQSFWGCVAVVEA